MAPRYAEKFTTIDGSTLVYTFPLALYDWDPAPQGLSTLYAPLSGAHYDYDQLGDSLAVRRNTMETMRFLVKGTNAEIEDELVECRQKCQRIGRGKLWTLDSTGARRWAYARLQSVPEFRLDNPFVVPVAVTVDRQSDWYDDTETDQTVTMDEASEAFNVTNDGDAQVFNAVFLLKGTFINPVITNTTNGYVLESTRDGSAAGHWLRFDAGKRRVEFSSNGGTSYAGDYANFVRQAGQVHLMVLEAGVNAFTATFGGTPSGTLDVNFYPAYHL